MILLFYSKQSQNSNSFLKDKVKSRRKNSEGGNQGNKNYFPQNFHLPSESIFSRDRLHTGLCLDTEENIVLKLAIGLKYNY